jgi:prepilin-type N-terminal cleavage/methylation domain-containing protein
MQMAFISRRGFTIVEMLAVILIIGTLVGLLLPSVQSARERARQTSCSNNLMQVGLAITAYHAAFDQFPVHMSGTDGSPLPGQDNDRRLSFLVPLLPLLGDDAAFDDLKQPVIYDQSAKYRQGMSEFAEYEAFMEAELGDTQSKPVDEQTKYWVVGGPEPFEAAFPLWAYEGPAFRCPSDPGFGLPSLGRTNYAACLGDGLVAMDTGPLKEIKGRFEWDEQLAAQTAAAMRGVFVPRVRTRMKDVTDGLSATIMCGEIATGLGDRDRRTDAAIGPGETVLRDNPNWAYEAGILDPERPNFWLPGTPVMTDVSRGIARGYRWADGAPLFTACNTILPPNDAITLSSKREDAAGILPCSSRHLGGAAICLADGSVRFITDSIDAGDRHAPTPYAGSGNAPGRQSVYGVWGAMGTRASEELVWPETE